MSINHRITYLLMHWRYYEQQREYLTVDQVRDAKYLFTALSKLSEDEFMLLKEKYYTEELTKLGTCKPVFDSILCKNYGINVNKYRENRNKILYKIDRIMNHLNIEFQNELIGNLDSYILSLNGWYISKVSSEGNEITLNRDKTLAKIFYKENNFKNINDFTVEPVVY